MICVHGDGSFGINAMELDTAVRHRIPVLVVVSLNGGWTADPQRSSMCAPTTARATTMQFAQYST